MSDDAKCDCGRPEVEHGHLLSECRMFRPAEEAKPEPSEEAHDPNCLTCEELKKIAPPTPAPKKCDCGGSVHMMSHTEGCPLFVRTAPESVYERARKSLEGLDSWHWLKGSHPAMREVLSALDAGEAAEKNYRWMVEHQADNKLEGYRELASKLCASEERAEAAEARAERMDAQGRAMARIADTAERDRDEARETARVADSHAKQAEEVAHQCQRERDEAQNDHQREHDLRVTATGSLESAMARVRELEAELSDEKKANGDLEECLRASYVVASELGKVTDAALALLKPARPEDGLLPAIRDVMQQLTNEREGGETAQKECERLEQQIAIMIEMWPTREGADD